MVKPATRRKTEKARSEERSSLDFNRHLRWKRARGLYIGRSDLTLRIHTRIRALGDLIAQAARIPAERQYLFRQSRQAVRR